MNANRSLSENNIPGDVDPQFQKILILLENLGRQVRKIDDRMERFEEDRQKEKEEYQYSVDMSQVDISQIMNQKEDEEQNHQISQILPTIPQIPAQPQMMNPQVMNYQQRMDQCHQKTNEVEQQQQYAPAYKGQTYEVMQPQVAQNQGYQQYAPQGNQNNFQYGNPPQMAQHTPQPGFQKSDAPQTTYFNNGCQLCGNMNHHSKNCLKDGNMIVNSHGALLGDWRQSNYRGSVANFNPQQKKNQQQMDNGQDARAVSTPARVGEQQQQPQYQ
jgi:hypothetical protein